MLSHARFWYSQMTLIHALCLWELPDRLATDPDDVPGAARPAPRTDPTRAVRRWLALAGSKQDPRALHPGDRTRKGDRLHPFVAEAAALAVLALESGHPEHFIWIDEIGAMNNIGSSPPTPARTASTTSGSPVGGLEHPAPAGAAAPRGRAPRAQPHRTRRPAAELEARLERADRTVLPPCLTKDRGPLRPRRTVGTSESSPPGSACLRDCPFELCPYPAMGEQPRAELREAFCRQQQALLRGYRCLNPLSWLRRKRAPWQGMTTAELRQFWEDMAVRSRTPTC
ncbi:hypothetical protein ACFQ2B_31310 [Streptomyces stramineus]